MDNPLLDHSTLPRFAAISPEHVEPALDELLAANRRVVEQVTGAGGATWDSVVAPLEAMDHRLGRMWAPVGHLNAVVNTPELRAAYNRCLPKLSAYGTELKQNEALFAAFRRVAEGHGSLDPAQRKVLEHALRDFRLAGVALSGEEKARFKGLMEELATLQARFEENLLDATHAWKKHVLEEARLAGLPPGLVDRAREAATAENLEGWLFTLDFPSYHGVLTHAEDRELRREFYEAWVTRASDRGPHAGRWDNTPVMERILTLRHEASTLLGFANYAEYSLATKMAGSPAEVIAFLDELATPSRPAAQRELAEVVELAGRPLEAWDIPFYSERLRRDRFAISDETLRPWFPTERVLAGLFRLTETLFDIEIRQAQPPDSWHRDVGYYEIVDGEGLRGSFYVDLYARSRKRGGAWMDDCVGRARLDDEVHRPVAFLVCNFMPASGKRPPLLTHDEVVTLFHEFGHTLHHLLTRIDYPSVSGINGVAWDAVELPSQFLENFAWEPEVLPMISGHYDTGEPLPQDLLERLLESRQFQTAMQMVRQLEFAMFDFHLHSAPLPPDGQGMESILADVRSRVAVVDYPDFNRFAHGFSHIFGGGYAAGYYSYKWAEVLSADAYEAFADADRVVDPALGQRFLRHVLEVGGSVDAMDAFIAFRGRRPTPEALLRQAGILGDG